MTVSSKTIPHRDMVGLSQPDYRFWLARVVQKAFDGVRFFGALRPSGREGFVQGHGSLCFINLIQQELSRMLQQIQNQYES